MRSNEYPKILGFAKAVAPQCMIVKVEEPTSNADNSQQKFGNLNETEKPLVQGIRRVIKKSVLCAQKCVAFLNTYFESNLKNSDLCAGQCVTGLFWCVQFLDHLDHFSLACVKKYLGTRCCNAHDVTLLD